MILISSEVKKTAFTAAELVQLKQWVEAGGILISPAVTSVNNNTDATAAARDLFGISASSQNKNRYRLLWAEDHYGDKELEYINEPEERTTSLGQGKKLTGESIKTFAYTLTDDANAVSTMAQMQSSAVHWARAQSISSDTSGEMWFREHS